MMKYTACTHITFNTSCDVVVITRDVEVLHSLNWGLNFLKEFAELCFSLCVLYPPWNVSCMHAP
jgi:hypothetical protein